MDRCLPVNFSWRNRPAQVSDVSQNNVGSSSDRGSRRNGNSRKRPRLADTVESQERGGMFSSLQLSNLFGTSNSTASVVGNGFGLVNTADGTQLQESKDDLAPKKQAVQVRTTKTCRLCFEPNAYRRPCCHALFCDHCYVKNRRCPNCNKQTKQEKLTGATYELKIYSEHEECRVCLDPGLLRRCCNNYYCDTCYYKAPNCRSCGTSVSNVGKKEEFHTDAYCIAVFLGWFVTVFVTLVLLCFVGVVLAAEDSIPLGVSDYRCYGFFRTCDVSQCVEMPQDVADGVIPLPPLSEWKKCTLTSKVKLQGKSCIYDHNLYHQSGRMIGYDMCYAEYNQGVYIFEDVFEHWSNVSFTSNSMQSAKWHVVNNGFSNAFCGASNVPGFRGKRSLSFRGDGRRYAETKDLDLSSGGRVETMMFFPPLGYDVTNPLCKTGYIGTVFAQYSTNQGQNWTTIKEFEPGQYRLNKFFEVKLEVPEAGWTRHTRIRFDQPVFEVARDNWALDNFKVLRYLPRDWHEKSSFISNVNYAWEKIQKAQCCLDTDWCSRRLTVEERKSCDEFDWYATTDSYLFRLSEIILCVAALLNLVRFVYLCIHNYLIFNMLPFHDELVELFEFPPFVKLWKKIPLKYRPPRVVPHDATWKIHTSARLEEKLRAEYDDGESDGIILKRKEDMEEERRVYEKKLRKQKKRLAKRMENKNFKASSIVVEVDKDYEQHLETYVLPFEKEQGVYDSNNTQFADDILPNELDRFRRQDVALLRVPFEIDDDPQFRKIFAIVVIGMFTVMFLFELSYTPYYSIYQPIQSFGVITANLYVDSVLIIFIAAYCDLKEIYHCLRYNIPIRKKWLPTVTADLSDDVRSLIVDHHTVPLENVDDITAFHESFIYWIVAGYTIGVFPWCLFSLLLREVALDYSAMRFVTPILGIVMFARAVLGPSVFIKFVFVMQHYFETQFQVREKIGASLQKESTVNLAINCALGLATLATFVCLTVSMYHAGMVFGLSMLGGFFYGLFTGTGHELPIKPWMCKLRYDLILLCICCLISFPFSIFLVVTTLKPGLFMRVRRRHKCPFSYWGKYCTDIQNYDEVFVLYITDEIKYTGILTKGLQGEQDV